MNFAADCLAATGLDSTQLGVGFAVALGVVAIGLVIFARSWRNRAVLALAPLLILAGIGGLALTSSSPAHAETSCETAAATPTPTTTTAPAGAAPTWGRLVFGNYDGMTPYVPNAIDYPSVAATASAGTIFLPACFWRAGSTAPSFLQQISARGDGTITYSATFNNALLNGSMTSTGLVTLSPTVLGTQSSNYSTYFTVTATNEFGSSSLIYTAVANCPSLVTG